MMADDGWETVRPFADSLRASLERALLMPVDWIDLTDPGEALRIEIEEQVERGYPEWRDLTAAEAAELLPLIESVLPLRRRRPQPA